MPTEFITFDLRKFLYLLRRRWFLLLSFSTAFTLITILIVLQFAPVFTAEVLVLLYGGRQTVIDIEEVTQELDVDPFILESEGQLIKSPQLALKVVEHLNLDTDAEFNPMWRRSGAAWSLNPLSYLPKNWAKKLGITDKKPINVDEISLGKRKSVNVFLSRLSVTPLGRSFVISIKFKSEDAVKAATIANTIADLYLEDQSTTKFHATRQARGWLNDRLTKLQAKVENSEAAIERYRAENTLVRKMEDGILPQQISELGSQLILARANRREAEVRRQHIEQLFKSSDNSSSSVADALGDDAIQALRSQVVQLIARISELSETYGEQHPVITRARVELADLRLRVEGEIQHKVNNLENEVAIAKAREVVLSSSLRNLEQQATGAEKGRIRLRELEREAAADRSLYETFLTRFKEISQQEGNGRPDAPIDSRVRIVSRAAVPLTPTFPKLGIIAGIAFTLSTVLGVTFVVLLEHLNRRLRTGQEVEETLDIPCIGLVPEIRHHNLSRPNPIQYYCEKPRSAFSEAIRSLRTAIILSSSSKPPKVVLIASSMPKEGKTSIASTLAVSAHQTGLKTILLDCDLRLSRVCEVFDGVNEEGIVEVVTRGLPIRDVMQTDRISGVQYITSGRRVDDPLDVLTADSMKAMLKELTKDFDLVVLDSPPVLSASDVQVLIELSDEVVFVVRWDRTAREVARLSIEKLGLNGPHFTGAILSRVNVREHANYGYPDSGAYYGSLRKYYSG